MHLVWTPRPCLVQLAILSAVLLATLALPARAGAVVRTCGVDQAANTADVLCTPPSGPCDATTVVVAGALETAGAVCTFDIGGRQLVIEGRMETDEDLEFVNATSVRITPSGVLKARGDFHQSSESFDGGGVITFDDIEMIDHAGVIDVSGEVGGDVSFFVLDDIHLRPGSVVRANGITPRIEEGERTGEGGTIFVESTIGRITLAGKIELRGQSFGQGGSLEATAESYEVVLTGPIDASGGAFDGGFVELIADVGIRVAASVDARSRGGGGFGGVILFETDGDIDVRAGMFDVRGSAGLEAGGAGGEFAAFADGSVRFGPETSVRADAGPQYDGSGGVIVIESALFGRGSSIIEGSLSARGGRDEDGGEVSLESGGRMSVSAPIDVSGRRGGFIEIGGEHGTWIGGSLRAAGTAPGRRGGEISLGGDGGFDVATIVADDVVATSGFGAFAGGRIDIFGCTLRVEPGVRLDVRDGLGTIDLQSRHPAELGARSRYHAGADGVTTIWFPVGSDPIIGARVVFDPPPVLFASGGGVCTATCGNEVRERGEQCDDGNLVDGDGCSATCQLQCPAAPASGCRTPTAPGASKLLLRDRPYAGGDQLGWAWKRGAATTLADWGDPLHHDDYLLCLYDESGTPSLAFQAAVPAGGLCSGKACWRRRGGAGFKYRSKHGSPDGIRALTLKAGNEGRASIVAKGKGQHMVAPPLPLGLPARVQLHGGSTPCWEATYGAASTNDATELRARSD